MIQSPAERVAAACRRDEATVAFAREVFNRLGDKWTMRTLDELAGGAQRFTALKSSLAPISHRVLTVTLRALEKDGMVRRTSYPEVPPRVEYELTPLGESFLAHTLPLVEWAQDHQQEIEAKRAGAEYRTATAT